MSRVGRLSPLLGSVAASASARVVDVLVQLKTSRFDRPLTYEVPPAISVAVGDVVRVPLGTRDVYAYVISEERDDEAPPPGLRPLRSRANVAPAFTAIGLQLATWIAEHYVCSLGEALGAVVLAGAIPRVVERFVIEAPRPSGRIASVPERLVALIWNDLREGFTLEQLLRHPEARRAGDRRAILRAIGTLARSGKVRRTRDFTGSRITARHASILVPGKASIAGPKAAALAARVSMEGELRRADALLEGFSQAVIARAIKAGAVVEVEREIVRPRGDARVALPPFEPTDEQRTAIAEIESLLGAGTFGQLLLHGVTGSGKTYVYLAAIARVIRDGGRAIVLVPEISLTPQTARRFEAAFGDRVAVLHSALSERERYEAWQAAARGDVAVVVGARSAVFAPLTGVRLIVVDEAHETSYKQDTVPRYHAVAVAQERMRRENGVLVTGSATPALEDFARAKAGRYPLVALARRVGDQRLPEVHVVDMARELAGGNRRIFSTRLVEALERRLAGCEKSVLFVNRRGTASFVLCRACGHVPSCARCTTSLALHRSEGLLRCHYCDAQMPIPERCPKCAGGPIREFGVGTERVQADVERLFPGARVLRMDSDTTTRIGDHARILDAFESEGDVLVGTQMVAKGLDFPTVTLAAVVAADIGLHIADFRAAERTFGLIMQVCGRSGRARPGEAIVQTYSPGHPAITFSAAADFGGFAELELAERRASRYPPYVSLVYLGIIGRARRVVEERSAQYAALLRDREGIAVLGPAPYPIARLNEEWRMRIALKSARLAALNDGVRALILPRAKADALTRLVVNVEP
jgi:primosomal protein N' (replication factor Y) (superfamily II helicase)